MPTCNVATCAGTDAVVVAAAAAADATAIVSLIAATVSAATPADCNALDVACNTNAARVGAAVVGGWIAFTNDSITGINCSAA